MGRWNKLTGDKTLLLKLQKYVPYCFWAVVAFLAYQSIKTFHPLSTNVHDFSADNAIAVMMVNDHIFDTFRLYFFGMDRIGLWPFLPMKIWSTLTGHLFSAFDVFVLQDLFVFLGFIPFARMVRSWPLGVMIYLLVVLGERGTTFVSYELCMGFAWQIPPLIWVLSELTRHLPMRGEEAALSRRNNLGSLVIIAVGTFLSCWSSFVSAVLALACFVLWFYWCYFARVKSSESRRQVIKSLLPRFIPALIAILVGVGGERLINLIYRINYSDVTNMGIDRRHFASNAASLWRVLQHNAPWWPLLLLGIFFGTLRLLAIAAEARKPLVKRDGERGFQSTDLFNAGLIFFTAGAVNFILAALSSHVRAGLHDIRYLVPTAWLGFLAAFCFLVDSVKVDSLKMPKVTLSPWFMRWTTGTLGLIFVWCAMPPRGKSDNSKFLQENANFLDTLVRAEGISPSQAVPIIGSYWGSYPIVGLSRHQLYAPVPLPHETNRTKWYTESLKDSPISLWSHISESHTAGPYVFAYGVLLQREREVLPLPDGQISLFSLYRNIMNSAQEGAIQSSAPIEGCVTGAKSRFKLTKVPQTGARLALLTVDRQLARYHNSVRAVYLSGEAGSIVGELKTEYSEGLLLVELPPLGSNEARSPEITIDLEIRQNEKEIFQDSCLIERVFYVN